MPKSIKITLVSILLIFLVFYIGFKAPKGDRYYLPEKYAGWVCITYGVKGMPALGIEDGFLVNKIPNNGVLLTSSEARYSPKRDEYFYYNSEGIREAHEIGLGGGFTKAYEGKAGVTHYFWISKTEADVDIDYNKYVKNRNINSDPKCGPFKP